jgi:hypothetical protein
MKLKHTKEKGKTIFQFVHLKGASGEELSHFIKRHEKEMMRVFKEESKSK